ncbi:MAG: OmpA family protein [Thermodesulfovibrionales bacterium]|nr:OmpA family protein [Thermodesulfovibrionales bacterium]
MKKVALFAILLFIAAGCAQKAVVSKTTPETQAVGQKEAVKKAEEAGKAEETKKAEEALMLPVIKKESISEKEITVGKKSEAGISVVEHQQEASAAKRYAAVVKAVCSGDTGGDAALGIIHFDFDSYGIRDDARPLLKGFGEWLTANKVKIFVEGYCDERGTTEYNLALGDRRAASAKDYLLNMGIPSDRIEAISCGEDQPVCTEKTEECWAQNRRARFVILADEKLTKSTD